MSDNYIFITLAYYYLVSVALLLVSQLRGNIVVGDWVLSSWFNLWLRFYLKQSSINALLITEW